MLIECFLAHAPAGRPPEPRLAETLDAALARARIVFPSIPIDEAAFVAWLAPRVSCGLEAMPVEELFVAWACARGDQAAIRELDVRYLSRLGSAVGRVDASREFLDDVLQHLREKLLVGSPPRIDTYDGAGPLLSWLRAAAVRTALNAKRPGAREVAADDAALEALPLQGPSPELEAVRTQHRAVFSQAFQHALAALTPRERNLLRLQVLDGLALSAIGEMYGANKSTVSRWLARAHELLLSKTREGLARSLALDDAALESLLRAMRSSLELSVARLLGPPEP